MAKKRSGPNKTQAILDYRAANPDSKPKGISEALAKDGIKVSPGYVSTILSKSKKTGGKTGRRGAGRPKATRAVKTGRSTKAKSKSTSSGDVNVDALMKIRDLVKDVGGVDEVRSALSTYEKLVD